MLLFVDTVVVMSPKAREESLIYLLQTVLSAENQSAAKKGYKPEIT